MESALHESDVVRQSYQQEFSEHQREDHPEVNELRHYEKVYR